MVWDTVAVPNIKNLHQIREIRTSCCNCSLSEQCLPHGLSEEDVSALDQIIKRQQPYQPGQHVFRAGDQSRALFVVRSGALKSYCTTEDVKGCKMPAPSRRPVSVRKHSTGRRLTTLNRTSRSSKASEGPLKSTHTTFRNIAVRDIISMMEQLESIHPIWLPNQLSTLPSVTWCLLKTDS